MANVVLPAFAAALRRVNNRLDDFRVEVIDACPRPATFHTRGLGGECNFESGAAWMDSHSARLEQEFRCVGAIDSRDSMCTGRNDDEQPASASAAAVELARMPGANHGFLRDDALLVVVAITDEDEQPVPAATARQVYDRLVAAKGGDPRRVVFLGIGGSMACDGVYGTAREARRLREVTQLFEADGRGVFWDLCRGRLEEGLTSVLGVIENACGELPPPPP